MNAMRVQNGEEKIEEYLKMQCRRELERSRESSAVQAERCGKCKMVQR